MREEDTLWAAMTKKEQGESSTKWINQEKALLDQIRCHQKHPHKVIQSNSEISLRGVSQQWEVIATCHGCELQQRLCRHFNRHASLQVLLVTFDGDWPTLRLDGPHSEFCGLHCGLHWDVLAQGFVLVRVPASTLLGPVQQLLTLRRIGNVGSEMGKKRWA